MDYDNPQFIAAIKKILRNLAGETDQDKSAAAEQTHAQPEQHLTPPVTHELHVSDATIDRIKTPTTQENRHEWWKDFVEVAGVGILLVYTLFAGFQWYELNTSNRNQSAANISSGATADRTLAQVQKTVTETHNLAIAAQEQAHITKQIYETSQRPYIGSGGIDLLWVFWDKDGQTNSVKSRKDANAMRIVAEIRNYGPVPGTHFAPDWNLFGNGVLIKGRDKIPATPVTLYPTQMVSYSAVFGGNDFIELMSGRRILDVEVGVDYDGPSAHYCECARYRLDHIEGGFFSLGECTHQPKPCHGSQK